MTEEERKKAGDEMYEALKWNGCSHEVAVWLADLRLEVMEIKEQLKTLSPPKLT